MKWQAGAVNEATGSCGASVTVMWPMEKYDYSEEEGEAIRTKSSGIVSRMVWVCVIRVFLNA